MRCLIGSYERTIECRSDHTLCKEAFYSGTIRLPGLAPFKYDKGNANYHWVASAIDSACSAHIPWVIVGELQSLLCCKRLWQGAQRGRLGHHHLRYRRQIACPG